MYILIRFYFWVHECMYPLSRFRKKNKIFSWQNISFSAKVREVGIFYSTSLPAVHLYARVCQICTEILSELYHNNYSQQLSFRYSQSYNLESLRGILVTEFWNLNEPHDKTNKLSMRPANSDQPGHPPSLIRVFTVRSLGCPGWSVFAGCTVILLVLSCCGSN